MYNISKEAAQAFRTKRALARIAVELLSGEEIDEITEHDIDTLSIERAAVSGNVIEIGAARLFELKLRLNNAEEKFNDVQFDGSHLRVRTGIKKDNGVELVPMGLFIVDGHEEDNGDLILTAFDYMVKFDREADFTGVVFPTTPARLIRYACDKCGVDPSRLNFSKLPNADYIIKSAPESAVTWRSVLMWCCQILGACAFTDAEGYLIVKWYTDTGEKLTASDRFSHKLFLKDVTVKGVEVVTDEAIYLAGSDEGFIFTIEENELITHDFESVTRNLGAALIGFTHRPYSTPTLSLPHIFPLDMMTYVKPNGEEVAVCVSSYKFTLNGRTELKGVGESETTSGFATLSPLTEKQKAVIAAGLRKVEKEAREEISEAEASLLRLNEVIGNSLGLYMVTHQEEDGSTQMYFCDKPTLEASGLIYAFNAGGFAWATEWKGSNAATVWNYGITRDGNAVLNYLTLNKLTAEQVSVAEIVGAINESSGEQELVINGGHIDISGKSLTTVIDGLVTETGESESFSYSMTSRGLTLTANGSNVLVVNKDGLVVNGTIYAEGGTIAGLEILQQSERDDNGNTVKVVKQLRNKTDSFHIKITEDANGQAKETEVLITDLLCDYIKANNSPNLIDLCYQGQVEEITATLAYNSAFNVTITGTPNGMNWVKRTVNINITLSGTVLTPRKVTVVWGIKDKGAYIDCSYTANITIPKGTSGVYTYSTTYMNIYGQNYPVNFAYFVETGNNTLKFTTAEETDTMLAIRGNTIPLETDAYNLGHEDKRWNEGHFKKLVIKDEITIDGKKASVPYLSKSVSVTVGVSNKNKPSDSTWESAGSASVNVITCGELKIWCVTYTGEVKNDRWYFFNTSDFKKIYSVQVTARGTKDSALSGDTHGGSLCTYWNSSAGQVFIGCDTDSSADGFEAVVIGI